jgi:hypothetical protein
MMVARRGMLKWWSGSKRMIDADWPERETDENDVGRIACAISR